MSTKKEENDGVVEIQSAIGKTEAFIEAHQKTIVEIVAGIVVLVLCYFAFSKFYLEPKSIEAQDQVTIGENYLAKDSFQLALKGDGVNYIGFEAIIDEYSITKAANLANAYAAICAYNLKDYESAIDYARDFDGNDDINVSVVINGLIGDAYSELENYDEALSYYEKAYESENPEFSALYMKKAAAVNLKKGDNGAALKLYQEIKTKYMQSTEAQDIEKYIERVSGK